MNEESEEAGYPDDQNPPPSSDSIPAPEPASPNQDNIKEGEMELEELTGRVIGCAIAVHRELGPGFVETIYENALIVELRHMEIPFQAQGERPILPGRDGRLTTIRLTCRGTIGCRTEDAQSA